MAASVELAILRARILIRRAEDCSIVAYGRLYQYLPLGTTNNVELTGVSRFIAVNLSTASTPSLFRTREAVVSSN